MTSFFSAERRLRWPEFGVAIFASVFLIFSAPLFSQNQITTLAALKGVVRDSHGHPLPGVTVSLQGPALSQSMTVRTDAQGTYSFSGLAEGSYTLHTELAGQGKAQVGPFSLAPSETKAVDLTLSSSSATMPEFSDEPQFTVAGVTQTGSGGGHGPENVQRASDALAKATASLSSSSATTAGHSTTSAELERDRDNLRKQLTRKDKAELHHQLADIEERLSDPLDAVRDYQRAAEMEPNETYLFDWGAELLAHRALEPAAEVFAKGHRLFPASSRMLLGLGVAQYARGSDDKAVQSLCQASDLNPGDSTPYLFLGKMQSAETIESPDLVEKFKRFATLQPENALASYYYAISLWKESHTGDAKNNSQQVESLLEKAIRIDPKLSVAHLQLGTIFADKGDLEKAIAGYRSALESDPELIEAHYRLGLAYRRTGQTEQAHHEFQLYKELSKKRAEQSEEERREIQQFVVTMRDRTSRQ